MDYREILSIVEQKLYPEHSMIIEELKICILSGSTGGEIHANVARYLHDLQFHNRIAYSILKNEIDKYLLELKSR